MNHRDFVVPYLEEFIKTHKKDKWKVLEVGGVPTTLKQKFIECGCEYHSLEKEDGEKMEETVKGNDFDLVFACHSFEHCERPVDALKNFKNHLKPGGHLFLATPNHCKEQIISGDFDHIFVLTDIQMGKLLIYTRFKPKTIFMDKEDKRGEKHWNLITIAQKE